MNLFSPHWHFQSLFVFEAQILAILDTSLDNNARTDLNFLQSLQSLPTALQSFQTTNLT